MRFLGFGLSDRVPDARTIWLFREKLIGPLSVIHGSYLDPRVKVMDGPGLRVRVSRELRNTYALSYGRGGARCDQFMPAAIKRAHAAGRVAHLGSGEARIVRLGSRITMMLARPGGFRCGVTLVTGSCSVAMLAMAGH